jgi:hypothetical protein
LPRALKKTYAGGIGFFGIRLVLRSDQREGVGDGLGDIPAPVSAPVPVVAPLPVVPLVASVGGVVVVAPEPISVALPVSPEVVASEDGPVPVVPDVPEVSG